MKLGAKKIIGGNAKDFINEMKTENHSKSKNKFMKDAKAIAKKHTK
ncbi:hypothetical protein [Fredinandcohnia quinoae]|uniref:Uncharacterized protein n=1 Tax=Fredinandcohnia quinoae TaxID=2918902 RepID=A0AAW5EAA8_9BACI|nr:hypothetical protein [Fredinandcohnia sp. SECRCQ15]MCH1625674.1 hypothetical protein [Fredinandcohnia sp. SECRCQ15]